MKVGYGDAVISVPAVMMTLYFPRGKIGISNSGIKPADETTPAAIIVFHPKEIAYWLPALKVPETVT